MPWERIVEPDFLGRELLGLSKSAIHYSTDRWRKRGSKEQKPYEGPTNSEKRTVQVESSEERC